jgi:hypothetical protein
MQIYYARVDEQEDLLNIVRQRRKELSKAYEENKPTDLNLREKALTKVEQIVALEEHILFCLERSLDFALSGEEINLVYKP